MIIDHIFATQKTSTATVSLLVTTIVNGVTTKTWTAGKTFPCIFWRGSMSDRIINQKIKADVSGVVIARPSDVTIADVPATCRLTIVQDTITIGTFSVIYTDDVAGQSEVIVIPIKELI